MRDAHINKVIITINDYTKDHDFDGATVVLDQLGDENHPARVLAGVPLNDNKVTLDYIRGLQ